MVRYDKCVESLYDRALVDDRSKSLQILKVMKGAISMSKSRTGDCIFRTNRTVKKDLERLVKIEVRNSNYNISRIDSNKKVVVGRWTRILENHTTCSSQTLFEEMLGIGKPGEHLPTEKDDDRKLQSLIDLRLTKLKSESSTGGLSPRTSTNLGQGQTTEGQGDEQTENKGDTAQFVTERKELRNKYAENEHVPTKTDGVVLAKTSQVHLPAVGMRREVTYAPTKTEDPDEYRPMLERDLTDWNNWALKDKSWITGFIHREKTKHEDLIIRNALSKIEQEMSGANMIKRHQLRQKLQNDKSQREIEQRKKERAHKQKEQSRELFKLSSASDESPREENKTPRKKHVDFSEPIVEILQPLKNQCAQLRRSKTLKKCKTYSVHLPPISEGAVPLKPPTLTT